MTQSKQSSNLAIACAAGGYRGAFSHGVLAALEQTGLRAAVYSAASSTVMPTAYAAAGDLGRLGGAEYWKEGWRLYQQFGSMSQSFDRGLQSYGPWLQQALFTESAARLLVATNEVVDEQAAARTQDSGFLRLGRQLLLAIRQRDPSWAKANLQLRWFDSKAKNGHESLTSGNLGEVFYASSRYLHSGWDRAAWIQGDPYIDAVYTAALPVQALPATGVTRILVIHHELGEPFVDFFRSRPLPAQIGGAQIEVIGPDRSLPAMGADVMVAEPAGLEAAYKLGLEQGQAWLRTTEISS